ncbi:UDP-N-acetylmuramate dehydrogenase [Bifidobacterium eulemuris]|uniref:UDP-N-acetylenolpyruvoylglucosamine reductase n=1 Tax=Bifidobacterium eulemuris TaxID=1765219 RepID=A0A261G4G4_9BIFI|nr:UDP-N-acetylmuramate dehydrogenase [Bifidobacterium eulemuris]OZG65906.1 UDP-N-acetylenolpyruvoylglucosamine reductase [Bifidobacterium eulemuris]QOL31975.1 UDP-N-acetylmuramate dehydrogenase [Bifidobacterium eulemuris]
MTSFADITTIGVGGEIARFVEPTSRVGVIEAIEDADERGLPLCVIGGGSNLLVADEAFEGIVVRDARRQITVPDEAAPVEGDDTTVHVNAEAGCNWDDFVAFTVELGLEGVEGLSGIPGTVGASVVQNIGAYGQEVAGAVESVEVWDRQDKQSKELTAAELGFGYRMSALKASMYAAPAVPNPEFFPTPRYVVLSVTFALRHSATGVVGYGQLAKALGVEVGDRMDTQAIRDAVLTVRAAKGMLEDATRYLTPAMAETKRDEQIGLALAGQAKSARSAQDEQSVQDTAGAALPAPDFDRHSCGSFFMNPILSVDQAARLPEDAPRFDATLPDGTPGVKTSAAWLIDHAGLHKGHKLDPQAKAGLSTLHTLALTNRGGATASDIAALAKAVQDQVEASFGIRLVPEPVVVGIDLR